MNRALFRQFRIEQHDRVRIHRAVLGRPERHRIHTRFPGHFRRRGIQAHHGVGEPRGIHVDLQSGRMRQAADRGDFLKRIYGAAFRGLRKADRRRQELMHGTPDVAMQRGLERGCRQLVVRPLKQCQPGPPV